MTAVGPSDRQEQPASTGEELPPPVSAVERANRMSAGNMLRSLLPLVAICLALVGWLAFVREDTGRVPEIDPTGSIGRAAEYAGYPLEAPAGLPEGFRATDTDVTGSPGRPVTLGVDYVTPSDEYVGFVTSDDPEAPAVQDVLVGAEEHGAVRIGGQEWARSTTQRGETALSRTDGPVTLLVTGSASEEELETVAAAVRPVGD